MAFVWIRDRNQYRSTTTGRYVSQDDVIAHVESIIDWGSGESGSFVTQFINGAISPADFGSLLKEQLKLSYLQQGILGKGGRDQMDQSDYGWIGHKLRDEYGLIDLFVGDIENLSEAQIRARAAQYFQATRSAYERGYVRAWGMPDLPAYPGDGTSLCVNGCKCRWIIMPLSGEGNFDCHWTLGAADHCATCVDRAIEWSPIQVRGNEIGTHRNIKA